MKFLLDSNDLFKIANDSSEGRILLARAAAANRSRCYVSVISVFEARAALRRGLVALPNLKALADVLVLFRPLPLPTNAAPFAAQAVDALEKSGFARDDVVLDSLIAGHAMARGYTLVTDNERHFKPVPGLVWVNWRKSS